MLALAFRDRGLRLLDLTLTSPLAPQVRATPALFEPIILDPSFRSFMDASFSMASMDGSIDGVAY